MDGTDVAISYSTSQLHLLVINAKCVATNSCQTKNLIKILKSRSHSSFSTSRVRRKKLSYLLFLLLLFHFFNFSVNK